MMNDMGTMMAGMGGVFWGMGPVWLLFVVLLALGIAALTKYLLGGRHR